MVKERLDFDSQSAFDALPRDLPISREIFKLWTQSPEMLDMLDDADIDSSNASALFEALDADGSGLLTPTELVEGLLKMRGPITKADVIAVRMKVRHCTRILGMLEKDLHIRNKRDKRSAVT